MRILLKYIVIAALMTAAGATAVPSHAFSGSVEAMAAAIPSEFAIADQVFHGGVLAVRPVGSNDLLEILVDGRHVGFAFQRAHGMIPEEVTREFVFRRRVDGVLQLTGMRLVSPIDPRRQDIELVNAVAERDSRPAALGRG